MFTSRVLDGVGRQIDWCRREFLQTTQPAPPTAPSIESVLSYLFGVGGFGGAGGIGGGMDAAALLSMSSMTFHEPSPCRCRITRYLPVSMMGIGAAPVLGIMLTENVPR